MSAFARAIVPIFVIGLAHACSREGTPSSGSTNRRSSGALPSSATKPAASGPGTPSSPADVRISIGPKSVTVTSPKAKSVACVRDPDQSIAFTADAEVDGSALGQCLRSVKTALGDTASSARVVIDAVPEATYQSLVRVIDTIRDSGALFPNVTLGPPTGSSPDLAPLAIARSPDGSDGEGLVVMLTKTRLVVGDDAKELAEYDLAEIATEGLPAKYKRNGRSDYSILPLAKAAAKYRNIDRQIREAKKSSPTSTAIIVADAAVPYRYLFEVLHTLEQSDIRGYQFMARTAPR